MNFRFFGLSRWVSTLCRSALIAWVLPAAVMAQVPTAVKIVPVPGTTVAVLRLVEVHFSEPVTNVQSGDLRINSIAATNASPLTESVYLFEFPQPPPGRVQAAWNPDHQIYGSTSGNRFEGTSFDYTLDPTLTSRLVRINEFMASNDGGIRDEDGGHSDWIELHNPGAQIVNLAGWHLTDSPGNLVKWRIPSGVTVPAKGYLLIWASGLDRTNPMAPLHTNFKLAKEAGNSVQLVYDDGVTVMSAFSPYPRQFDDVSYGSDRVTPAVLGYFTNATPGTANATLGPGFGPEVQFSRAGGNFQQPFDLSLTTEDPNAVIRYVVVTNGASAMVSAVPTASSPIYTGPIPVASSVQVRARAFSIDPQFFPGPLHNEAYLKLDPAVANFSSDLPIVVFHNMGGGAIPFYEDQFVTIEVFDNKHGRASLLNPPDMVVQGYFHRRGQSTLWNEKANLRVETQDAYGDNLDVELLGMPAENDWIFYGIDAYDKALMHNPLTHSLYRDLGHYTSNTRFVEVFVKDNSGIAGTISTNDYNGLYVLEEKIKIGKNRVDIDKLRPENTKPPSVTGGYLLSIDKGNPGWADYLAGAVVWYLDPDFTQVYVPEQLEYVQTYFNRFFEALTGPDWTDPVRGYAAYIDMDSWLDFHLHQTLVFSADALRISTYFSLPRNGKIVQGPLWDFDRSFGTRTGDDARGFNPRRWRSSDMDGGTDMFNPANTFENPWYGRMFKDPNFWQAWIDRYQELRRSTYSLTNLHARIDRYAEEVREATAREYARWPGNATPRFGAVSGDGFTYVFPTRGTWQGEVDFTKHWFSNRVSFMDFNFLNPPVFSTNGGPVSPGFTLTITAPTREPDSIVYYTLDGTDPRLPGGSPSPQALSSVNSAAVVINENVRVFARNWNTTHKNLTGPNNPPISSPWSGPLVGTFVTATPALRITEIMYNPPAAPVVSTNNNDDFEYLEFQNTGEASINLRDYRVSGDVELVFPDYTLAAGQVALVVRNLGAFQSRYPEITNIVGAYTNALNNSGGHLVLTGPLKEPILDFSFNDTWYPSTDGLGFALAVRDVDQPVMTWDSKAGWQPGATAFGSPGVINPTPSEIPPISVNEALTHTDLPKVDVIEVFNPTTNAVALGGWFLTDDRQVPAKYKIPAGATVPAEGFLTFTADQFNVGSNRFNLSSIGDEVYLFSADPGGQLTGYAHGYDFGAAPNGVSFGRFVNSVGDESFVLQSAVTLESSNLYPRIGPLVISEIMYDPLELPSGANDFMAEYIEVSNISTTNVPLYDPMAATNTWRLRNAVDFDFPPGLMVAAGERLILVGFDPVLYPQSLDSFRAKYGVLASVRVLGPWRGRLDNGGEAIELQRPDAPNVTPTNTFVPYYLVEKVAYQDKTPWPVGDAGPGFALQRFNLEAFGNDPANWRAVAPFSGQPTIPVIAKQPTNLSVVAGGQATLSGVCRGTDPLRYQWYFNATNALAVGTNSSLTIFDARIADDGGYHFVLANGYGSVTSKVARLTVGASPVFTIQPADQTIAPGGVARFVAGAEGSLPINFRWFLNTNTFIPGDADYLTLYSIKAWQLGTYHVVASNAWGTAVSRFAKLSFGPDIDASSLRITESEISLTLSSTLNTTYELQYKTDLNDPNWITVQPPVQGDGGIITLYDTNTPFQASRFYRISSH